MEADDAIARLPARDAAADGDDGAGDFVPENLRAGQQSRAEFF